MVRKNRMIYSHGNKYKTKKINGKVFKSNETFLDKTRAKYDAEKYRKAWGYKCRIVGRKADRYESERLKVYQVKSNKVYDLWFRKKK